MIRKLLCIILAAAIVAGLAACSSGGKTGGTAPTSSGSAGQTPASGQSSASAPDPAPGPAPGSASGSAPVDPSGSVPAVSGGSASTPDASVAGSSAGAGSQEAVQPAGPLASGTYVVPSGARFNFRASVLDDVTGLWRFASTSDTYDVEANAFEYYKCFFSSDDEVHAVWNATQGTMTRIDAAAGIVTAATFSYVDGEEHSAKTLFSGEKLSETSYDAKTGEIYQW